MRHLNKSSDGLANWWRSLLSLRNSNRHLHYVRCSLQGRRQSVVDEEDREGGKGPSELNYCGVLISLPASSRVTRLTGSRILMIDGVSVHLFRGMMRIDEDR